MAASQQQQPSSSQTTKLSKRQKRALGSNPSTAWQQQPRIKSANARARAYINYANLADDKKKKQTVQELLNPTLSLHSPEVKFGRLLGGTDQHARHGAVKMLREYLRARSDFTNGGQGLSELDLLKLWKGLWYTLYMADKTPVQDKLSKLLAELMWCLSGTEEEDEYAGQVYMQMENGGIDDIEELEGEEEDVVIGVDPQAERELFGNSDVYEDDEGDTMEIVNMDDKENGNDDDELEEEDEDDEEDEEDMEEQRINALNEAHCRGAHLVSIYLSTFLQTVRREWGNVDKHRVDKFYTAVRYMVSEAYKYMAKRHWNIGIIRLFNDVLYNEALAADTPGLTNGLRYHLIDICVDELAKVNMHADLQLTEATFLDALEPFFGVAQNAEDKLVQKRVMDNVLLKFLNEYSVVSATALDEEVDDDDKALVFHHVHVGSVSSLIFQIASDPNTDERYRKSLYDMHKTYARAVKQAGTDVDLSDYSTNDDDEEEGNDNDNMQDDEDDDAEEKPPEEQDEDEPSEEQDTEPASKSAEKKKKKKKKQKTHKKGGEGNVDAAESIEEAPGADAATTPKTKSSKKKRKQNDNKEEPAPETPKEKPSNKKRKNSEDTEQDSADLITSHVETPKPSSKKKKKKKKKKDQSPPSVDPRSMPSPDQVMSDDNDDIDATAASRRVSFGKMNHCKSHKASIKAIKTLDKDRWDTVTRTPDKSILKNTPKKKQSGKKKRRL